LQRTLRAGTLAGLRLHLAAAALVASMAVALPGSAVPAPRNAPATPPPPRTSLSRVLARTFRFYGGVGPLLSVGGLRVRGTVLDGVAAPGSRPQVERLLQPPDRFRAAITLGGVERESLVLDGGRAFRDGLEVTGLSRADQIRLEAARTFLPAALARERTSLVDRGEARRAGRLVRLVELPLHEKATLTAEVDPWSGRILRTVTRVAGRESVVAYDRFRPVAGLLFPFAEDHRSSEGRRRVMVQQVEIVPADAIRIDHP
jgi:hypothetical protein